MRVVKPKRLQKGDTVAVVSPSWGGPHLYPHIYEAGLRALQEVFGLNIREYPTARTPPDKLYRNPRLRAQDLNKAFSDPDVKAILAAIGGDDSVRILPHLDGNAARKHPKILMGFSDTTTLLAFYNQAGLVTFHGPSIMAGFAQTRANSKGFEAHVKTMLFERRRTYRYTPYPRWYEGYPDWKDPRNTGKAHRYRRNHGWRWLQGTQKARGLLFGGSIEVLEIMKGTEFWPKGTFWEGKILFLETSEKKPTPDQVKWMLRNYGMQGVFNRIRGLLFGRPRGYTTPEKEQLKDAILAVVAQEFVRPDLPVVADVDFGHTDPQLILPLGIEAEIDCQRRRFRLLESPTHG